MLKYGKKIPSNLEDYKDIIKPEGQIEKQEENQIQEMIEERAKSQGMSKVVDVGTTTKQIGNTIITTKTTQISYKRRRCQYSNQ